MEDKERSLGDKRASSVMDGIFALEGVDLEK